MAIIAITQQPSEAALQACMRPIVFKTTTAITVPMVFCDLYINDLYKGTFEATAYESRSATVTEWKFDIRSKVQEYFTQAKPAAFNGSEIVPAGSSCRVFVKLRDSSIVSGILIPEGPEPVQAFGTELPIPGGGTSSNQFYVFFFTLQHEHNQNLATHLTYYRNGDWRSEAYPLSHRPRTGYQVLPGQTDYFPFALNQEDVVFGKLRLHYRRVNRVIWQQTDYAIPEPPAVCNGHLITILITTNPNGSANVTYSTSGATHILWTHPEVSGGSSQGPVTGGSFSIAAMPAGTYTVTILVCCDDVVGETVYRDYTISDRPFAWRGRFSDAVCETASGDNTGYLVYQTLEQVYTDVTPNALTGQTKTNSPSDPDYVSPVLNTDACPVPPPPTSGRLIIGREGTTESNACAATYQDYFIALDYLVPEVGTIIYINPDLSTPLLLKPFFITDVGTCSIYPSTGEVTEINSSIC
jgi:hypothetical protein